MEYIKLGSKIIMVLNVLLIVMSLIYVYKRDYWGYSYITMNNNKGIASKCYVNDDGLFCKVNGGLVEVKQYGKR